MSVITKYYSFERLSSQANHSGNDGKVSNQLMKLYQTALTYPEPVILELGTGKGQSTTMFLQACHERDGRLVSVDLKDFSDVTNDLRWVFIQSDSRNVEHILEKAPHLKEGIDILYIDSHHEKAQVEAELMSWYPYLKVNSTIFFDDVDANPYRKGNRKDHYESEKNFSEINKYIKSFFYSNEDDLFLEISYGSTGLAQMRKLSPLGTKPKRAKKIHHRKNYIINSLPIYFRRFKRKLKFFISN